MPQSFDSLINEELARKAQAHQLRARRVVRAIDAVHVEIGGRTYTNFCGNDYLGLSHHPVVIAAMRESAAREGVGSGAAGLISGHTPAHAAAESAIAAWKGTESAVLLPSGYQANHAAVQTLAALGKARPAGVRFVVDKLAHASLLDAIRGCEASWRIFPHNNMKKLGRLLREAPADQLQVVVSESIFSMDGDAANLSAIAALKQKTPFVLLLDEAHAGGIYGPGGAGLAAELGLSQSVDVAVATFSKAAGCGGGAICASGKFCEAVLNFGRAYIYSTSVPPPVARAIESAIGVMRDEPRRARRVRELSRRLRSRLQAGCLPMKNGLRSGAGVESPGADSPIIPVILGDEAAALQRGEELFAQGLLVQAVRPPTVSRGTSRLRVTVSCEHSDVEIDQLIGALLK